MDINTLRLAVMVGLFLLFIALVVHTCSRGRRPEHAAAALLPFAGEPDATHGRHLPTGGRP